MHGCLRLSWPIVVQPQSMGGNGIHSHTELNLVPNVYTNIAFLDTVMKMLSKVVCRCQGFNLEPSTLESGVLPVRYAQLKDL